MIKNIIIVAGGSGKRMNNKIPKQFLIINKKPILLHTMQRFYNYDKQIKIILVLPATQISTWKSLCTQYHVTIPHQITEGGTERFLSVKNGLKLINNDGLIAIHDGVRPLVNHQTIHNCFLDAEKFGTAIPVIDIVETIREISDNESKTVNRSSYKIVQTPQIFKSEVIKKAYNQQYSATFTDDASVVESIGCKIHLTAGNQENIKITTPIDLKIAETLL